MGLSLYYSSVSKKNFDEGAKVKASLRKNLKREWSVGPEGLKLYQKIKRGNNVDQIQTWTTV